MITDDELTHRLRDARVTRPEIPSGTRMLLVSETRDVARARTLRARVLAGTAGAVVLSGAVVATPAMAEAVHTFLAQSAWTSEGSEVIADSEFVDTSAPDLGAYIDTIYPRWLPLAPGQSREALIEEVRASAASVPALRQEVGIRRDLEHAVYVGWIDEWIRAHAAGDSAAENTALGHLRDAPTWPAFTATDGGGVTDIMAAYADELARGNEQAAQELAQVEEAPAWDGVDRLSSSDSFFDRFLREVQER